MTRILLSAALLYLAFPNVFLFHGFPSLAWVFAVPLFQALENKPIVQRLRQGALWGILAYGLIANWFVNYSLAGSLIFIFLLSAQAVIFAALFSRTLRHDFREGLLIAAAWTVSECARGFFMRGLSWDIGHTQTFQPFLVQFADVFGSKGLSFLIIFVNYSVFQILRKKTPRKMWLMLVAGIFLFLTFYGIGRRFWQEKAVSGNFALDVCLVQPNIDFHSRQQLENIPGILESNIRTSEECFQSGRPDIIIWPETSIPDDFRQDAELLKRVQAFTRRAQVPLLLGAALEEQGRFYNSAVLVMPEGDVWNIYRKRYLVPFTEYMPGGRIGDGLGKFLRIVSCNFSAGKSPGIFSLPSRPTVKAGILICSEDTLSELFLEYRRAGADVLVVLLNNGWFRQDAGLGINGQQPIMHAVESRIPVIRVANNGWSGVIDRLGRLDSGGFKFYQAGAERFKVFPGQGTSFYPVFGQIFCVFCWGFVIITAFQEYRAHRKGIGGVY